MLKNPPFYRYSEFKIDIIFVNIFIEVIILKKYFYFNKNISAISDLKMINGISEKLWHSFCFNLSELELLQGEPNIFCIGDIVKPILPNDKEYAISVTENGVCIVGRDFSGLMRGFFVLLMKIEYENLEDDNVSFRIPICAESSDYVIKNRMIHICVFPENDFYYIKKLIRLSAICQYTHIVIEFWGMLKYDCLKELSWEHAFTKEQVKEIIDEARKMGIEPIPMFNMFGHATASRLYLGKHVVLDQNPKLQYYFTPDGWAWDITSEKVYNLLSNIRKELYELYGNTKYFHIGCDEAYFYTKNDELRKHLPNYLKRLTNDVVKEGYRPMLWMDMILERSKFPNEYYAFGKDGESDVLLKSLNSETVMVDWQYDAKDVPIKSSVYLKDKDSTKDLIIAPWFDKKNYNSCIDTVNQHDMFGIMLTTWHTLNEQMLSILSCAIKCGAKTFCWSDSNDDLRRTETATLLRRVSFEGNDYSNSGWSKNQINI